MELDHKEVVIVQRRLTQYRVPLFEALRHRLKERGIRLRILHGLAHTSEAAKNDSGSLEWAEFLPTRYFLGGRICWQNFLSLVHDSNLVIVTQENKLLQNHWSLIIPRQFRLAFWGHGANLQSQNPDSVRERFKRWTSNRADWWFAYTHMSAQLIAATGYPRSRITVIDNAVDTVQMRHWSQQILEGETRSLRQGLGIGTAPVAVYVGSLYIDKRLDFLLAAAEVIRRKISDFHLLIIGDGPERDKIMAWCHTHLWMHWVGPRFGREKLAFLSTAQVMLMPGAVGLSILDSFVSTVPIVTTDCRGHGPEIAYLKNGMNGIMTPDDVTAYSDAVVQILKHDAERTRLRVACQESAGKYTLENMISQFVAGITNCLETPPLIRGMPL